MDKKLFKVVPLETIQKLEKLLMQVSLPLSASQHFLPILNELRQAQTVEHQEENTNKPRKDDNPT